MTTEDIIVVALGIAGAVGVPIFCFHLAETMRKGGSQNCEKWVCAQGGRIVHMDLDFNAWRELKGIVKWVDPSGRRHTMRYTGKSLWTMEQFENTEEEIAEPSDAANGRQPISPEGGQTSQAVP